MLVNHGISLFIVSTRIYYNRIVIWIRMNEIQYNRDCGVAFSVSSFVFSNCRVRDLSSFL